MFFRTDGAPSPVSTERQSRTRRPPSTGGWPAVPNCVGTSFAASFGLGAIDFKACGTRIKRAPEGCSFFARESFETVSDELCKVSQKQRHKMFCMWLEKVKKDFSYFQWLNLYLISL